jgi:transcriptional regulator with PAS, ATPase and Fis domain
MIAASNIDITRAIQQGNFREDLFYRLNTVPIFIPPLKERIDDIYLLFKKFAQDFAERYRMPAISLNEEAVKVLETYDWPGNIRQLKNITEQISIIEKNRIINAPALRQYLPDYQEIKLPAILKTNESSSSFSSEREILYKILFDMKNDVNDLKKLVLRFVQSGVSPTEMGSEGQSVFNRLFQGTDMNVDLQTQTPVKPFDIKKQNESNIQDTEEILEESLSIRDKEIELIKKSLDKHNGKRKLAADELGISERTLYRKIKEYNLE